MRKMNGNNILLLITSCIYDYQGAMHALEISILSFKNVIGYTNTV